MKKYVIIITDPQYVYMNIDGPCNNGSDIPFCHKVVGTF